MKKLSISIMVLCFFVLSCKKIYEENSIENNLKSSTITLSKHEMSGKELFKSIFFGLGDYSKQIEEFKNIVSQVESLETNDKVEYEEKIESFCNKIIEGNPNFFNDFKTHIVSNNHNDVKNALESGSVAIYENMNALIPLSDNVMAEVESDIITGAYQDSNGDFDESKSQELGDKYQLMLEEEYEDSYNSNINSNIEPLPPCSWAVVCVVYFAIAAHNTVAVAVNVVAAAAVAVSVALWIPDSWDGCPQCPIAPPTDNDDELYGEMIINSIVESL